MKMKNRRSLSRAGAESETAGPDYDCDPGKRRKSTDNMRVRRKSKSPRRTHPNGSVDMRVGKKRKPVNPNETSVKFASPKTVHQSNCSSSASSVVSCPPDTVDPYEFAVKADEESTDYPSNPSYVSNSSSVPPMKMMKLDRMDDRCLSDSARSSPLSQPLFTQSSPDSHSSPLTVNCTRPLSVLTDFSSTPSCAVRRSNGDMDSNAQSSLQHHNHLQRNVPVTTSVPYPNNLNTLISRPTQSNYCSNGLSFPLTSECNTSRKSKLHTTSPMSKSSMDFCNLNPSPLGNNHTDDPDVNSPSDPSIPRPNPLAERKIRATSPTVTDSKRCVGVNTVLDTSKSTSTEPDLLGPCEPGTTICLNGIVWLETTTGVLVVNVTWRGRTYIGTLLDATQHDFAPPCPRDYIPAFKSNNMRSSNRSKRRSALNNTYRHQNNQLLSNSSDFHGKTIGANQRHRLRERNGSFPSTGDSAKRRDPHTKNDVPELTENIIDASNEIDKCRNEAGSGTISDEDVGCDSKRPKNNSDDCPASVDTDLGTTRPSGKPNNVPLNHDGGSTVDDSKKDRNDDAELHSSFPIICPIDGCQKRFTNMTALRFHLNHKRHETTSARVSTTCTTILHTSPDKKLDKRSTPDIPSSWPTSDISPVNDQHNRTDRDDLRKVSNDPSCKTSALFGSRTEQNDLPGVDSREPPSIINSGLSTELPGPHSSSRTVTAHTVSVPCGLTDICEKSEHSVGRTNLAHSSANKQRSRIDSGKSRGPGTKTSIPSVKSESGHMGSTRCLDFAKELAEHYNLPQFNARSTVNRMENSSNGFTQLNHSLPVLSHCPTSSSLQPSNSLLSLAAGMWGFPNSNNGQTASNTYGDIRYLPPGMPPSSIFPPHFRSLTQSTLNLSNSDNSHCDSVQDHRPVSTATNSCNASMDAASLYGLPEFLMAAAMNALNPNGVSNALENANRSQIPSTAIPRTLPSASPHTNLMQTSTYSLKTSLPSGCSTTPISMAPGSPMFGGSMLPAGSLSQESLMLNPPSFHGSSSLAPSDKADPFKLSAAYLMQQAVAGSQLSSIFGQQ